MKKSITLLLAIMMVLTCFIPLTVFAGNEQQPPYTVTYKDGANGTVFADKNFSGLEEGAETPNFGDNPIRENYEFAGWSPAFSEEVNGNVEYTALWKPEYSIYAVYDDQVNTDPFIVGAIEDGSTIGDLDLSGQLDEYGYVHEEFYKDVECMEKYPESTVFAPGMKLYVKYSTKYITINVPFTKVVKKGGTAEPTKTDFNFEINMLQLDDNRIQYIIENDSITTDGAKEYSGIFSFKISEMQYIKISDGFFLREVAGDEKGWEYSDEVYYVTYNEERGKPERIAKLADGDEMIFAEEIGFINTYTGYNVTASAGTGGKITPAGKTGVYKGASLNYSISADDGYIIEDVLVDGQSVGTVNSYKFSDIKEDHRIEAVFAKKDTPSPSLDGETSTPSLTPSSNSDGGTSTPSSTLSSEADSVKTGDSSNVGLYIILMLIASLGAGIALIVYRKRIHSSK